MPTPSQGSGALQARKRVKDSMSYVSDGGYFWGALRANSHKKKKKVLSVLFTVNHEMWVIRGTFLPL